MTTHDAGPDAEVEAEPTRQDFAAFLMAHAEGASHDELSTALAEVIAAVKETGRKGSITYTVHIVPDGRAKLGNVAVTTDEIKVKKPEGERPSSIWFMTDDNRLSEDNPRQHALFNARRGGGDR